MKLLCQFYTDADDKAALDILIRPSDDGRFVLISLTFRKLCSAEAAVNWDS